MLTTLDLFSGIGGFAAGMQAAGMRPAAFCEIDPFCRAVLARHWPGAFIHDDVRTLTATLILDRVGRIPSVITAGVPCQPASVAGRRKGSADERWLWPELLRIVREMRDAGGAEWVVAENVPGFASIEPGLDWYCDELEAEGYEVAPPVVIGAEHVGAPHKRHRVWIVANAARDGQPGQPASERADRERAGAGGNIVADAQSARAGSDAQAAHAGRSQSAGRGDALANPDRAGLGELGGAVAVLAEQPAVERGGARGWPSRPGEPQHGWEHPRLIDFVANAGGEHGGWRGEVSERGEARGVAVEGAGRGGGADQGIAQRGVGVAVDGLPAGLVRASRRHNRDTLKAAGNAVVPAVVEIIGRAILMAAGGAS